MDLGSNLKMRNKKEELRKREVWCKYCKCVLIHMYEAEQERGWIREESVTLKTQTHSVRNILKSLSLPLYFSFPVLHSMLWFLLSRNGWPQTQIFSCHSPQKERSRLCLGFLVSHGHLWLNLAILSHTLSTQSDREDWVLFEITYLQ